MTDELPKHTARMKSQTASFVLRLRALPNWPLPPEQRLKAALKRLLRDHGLRAVECRPETADNGQTAAKDQASEHTA